MKGFGKSTHWSPEQLIAKANEYAFQTCQYKGQGSGLPPPMQVSTVGKMGLKPFRHLFNLVNELPGKQSRGGSSARGGAGNGRGRGAKRA